MAWYLRKSLRLGPIRFNLSKSGIGTSVGVKGFRVGVRPNGKSYIHAGRYGLYYRQELGGGASRNDPPPVETAHSDSPHPDTIYYDSASSRELTSQSKRELLSQLNQSYSSTRLDYVCGTILSILSLILLFQNVALGLVLLIFTLVATGAIGVWESRRRTITITYELDSGAESLFKEVISAFNNLACNQSVWAMVDSRDIHHFHESKLNAGAGTLVNRTPVQIGEGNPPWVVTNISVPVLKARNTALYMMPDGIFVYDSKGVGFVNYENLSATEGTTRFIEERAPGDSTIVGQTWKYPNKNGGPDKRFKNNYEVPVCLYGELKIRSRSGLYLYLMTSRHESPAKFCEDFASASKMIESSKVAMQERKENSQSVSRDPVQDLKKHDTVEGNQSKRKISAKAVMVDINNGMDSVGLMQKYELSSSQLATLYRKLDEAGMRKKD